MAESVFRARCRGGRTRRASSRWTAPAPGLARGRRRRPARRSPSSRRTATSQEHSARQFQAAWFPLLDLVIALDERASAGAARRSRRPRGRREGAAAARRTTRSPTWRAGDLDVPDPYFGGMDGFEECLADGRGGERRVCSTPYAEQSRSRRHEPAMSGADAGDGTEGGPGGAARAGAVRTDPARTGLRRPLPSARRAHRARTPTAATPTRPGPIWSGRSASWRPRASRVETIVFASGMAAVSAVLLSQLTAGRRGGPAGRRLSGAAAAARAAGGVRRRGADRADRRRRPAGRAGRGAAAVDRDAVQSRARRVRRAPARRGRARGAARWSPSTTPSPPRSASARWSWARTSRWPATPRA